MVKTFTVKITNQELCLGKHSKLNQKVYNNVRAYTRIATFCIIGFSSLQVCAFLIPLSRLSNRLYFAAV